MPAEHLDPTARALHHEAVALGPRALRGVLARPGHATGLVVFVQGSGGGRSSSLHRHTARCLQRAGLATLLVDLLSDAEAHDRTKAFDVELLAERLGEVIDWAGRRDDLAGLPLALLGVGTGASAAFLAAERRPGQVAAVVSRSGRPDLADGVLGGVHAPALLLVGADDPVALSLNRAACTRLPGEARLELIRSPAARGGETVLPDRAARAAADWLVSHLGPARGGYRGAKSRAFRPEIARAQTQEQRS